MKIYVGLILYMLVTMMAAIGQAAGVDPIRQAGLKFKVIKYTMTSTSTGVDIDYSDVCSQSLLVPVFDFLGNGNGGIIPSETLAVCQSVYLGEAVTLRISALVQLNEADPLDEKKPRAFKTFFADFFIDSDTSGKTLTGAYNTAGSEDLNLKTMLLELSTSSIGHPSSEGFLLTALFNDDSDSKP